ncbi:MAG: argininosuccinate lyase [Pyrinomonadaceae bacterium]|nr:argininosuccinate lyase [Pyrinomonadaceae bacterium]MBP6211615.1 argininosuccinate lyase [Pyrinomonadaceae bacterium]
MTKTGQLWGGRFTEKPDETFAEFNDSFRFDRRLFVADVSASIAHANGLADAGVITADECSAMVKGLGDLLEQDALNDAFFDGSAAEDVHSFIEGKLIEVIGDTGRKLHTGRSRNDQVATAFRLWLRYEIDAIDAHLRGVQSSLLDAAERHKLAVLPGYTHLQRAQPVMWAHWCLAYFEMLKRDRERLADARKRVNIMPLGAGALAGTGFPIDRESVARELGFDSISANSLDAVSDRDFAVEFTSACSLVMVHLSRLAEDLIIYCSTEFGFVTLSDSVSSGSSLMPQKKNPDALELLRGKSGRVFGNNMALLATLKGLPLAYNKDMQEDKEGVFDTVDTVNISLRAAAIVLDNLTVNEARTLDAAAKGYLNATELADYLVKKGVPFRTAHEAVGRAVLFAIGEGRELNELTVEQLQQFSSDIGPDVAGALTLDATLASKGTIGGTSPARVADAFAKARNYLNG